MAKVSDSLFLRKVITTDEKLLLNWANDSETRKWSFNSKAITPGEHKEWWYHHMGCRTWFFAMRDTRTNVVKETFVTDG